MGCRETTPPSPERHCRRLCRRKQPLSPLCCLSRVAAVLVTGCDVDVAGTATGAAATWFPRVRLWMTKFGRAYFFSVRRYFCIVLVLCFPHL
ncbi:uncharacterized protein LOC107622287 isoform X2 [Arachis ipaensis]|uniref:uncharacterized protein LOC107622287 isoform X2 n=1 Tax=Arachis ipaensis TaxID=130454 RepID=UPI000A2B830C|nr:uncharacterized protein LOC107622287 isoform X2 [Arachis ipaensis]